MDILLVTVTTLSLAIAATLGILLARTAGEQRRRSDARVSLLMDLADVSAPPSTGGRAVADLELRPSTTPPGQHDHLFAERAEPAAWPRRRFAVGIMAVIVGGAVFAWSMIERTPRAPVASTAAQQPPLELLSLSHRQQGSTLVITGLVQSPRQAAAPLAGVQATALVFGGDGTLLASGRAPIDFAALAPGEESPFVIRVTAEGAVRYRIGFRGPHDETLAHVDRRNLATFARKETP
jgi:hypothetical protein